MRCNWEIDKTEESEEQEQDVFAYRISSYPADITLRGYLDKCNSGQLEIPPFQRNYVWDQVKASKLIESFLLGLPVPGVFLYKNRMTNKLSVIDGQQRIMSSIKYFKNEFDEKIFRLKNVLPKWNGKTYGELEESDRFQLDDTVLRATVVQQLDPEDDSSIYHIFERLNTGGINLNPMEIRKCVYFGDFFNLLEELNKNKSWRSVIAKHSPDKRLRDVEMVLRCLALHDGWKSYEKPMKGFLNKYMEKTRRISEEERSKLISQAREVFERIYKVIDEKLKPKPFHLRGKINYAVMDSIFNALATMENIPDDIGGRYEKLIRDDVFFEHSTHNTSDIKSVQKRFERALSILSE